MNHIKLSRAALLVAALLPTGAHAQDPCEGNGLGKVYIETSPAKIGGNLEIDLGSPDLPFGLSILAWSDGFTETTLPPIGTVCLDLLSPSFNFLAVPLDATGNAHLVAGMPADPTLAGTALLYLSPATINGVTIEIGKTVPLVVENGDSFTPTGDLILGRSMHRTTALGQDGRDNRIQVFISGGGTGTIFQPDAISKTEIFQPLDRSFGPGPDLSQPRAFHSATLLEDGRVLIAGGCDFAGLVTATCEIYDHSTGILTATGSMGSGRIAHTATRLGDGRVLVAGGLADYTSPSTALAATLSTAQDTAEVYDPALGTWTAVTGAMSSSRSGHTAHTLDDGTVLLISGVNGGVTSISGTDVPTFTSTVDLFDPSSDTLSAAPAMPLGRGFHGTSRLSGGDVLVTGGLITAGPFGEALATSTCYRFDGATWTQTGSLSAGVAFHSQVATDADEALVSGGYLGDFVTLIASASNGVHDGTSFTQLTDVGENVGLPTNPASPRGAHTMTRLWDGSLLLLGGFHSPDTSTILVLDDGFIYTSQ